MNRASGSAEENRLEMGWEGIGETRCRQYDTRADYQASEQNHNNAESEQKRAEDTENEKIEFYTYSSSRAVTGSSPEIRDASVHSTADLGTSMTVLTGKARGKSR